MRFFGTNILKELKRRFNQPWPVFFWLAIPVTIGLLMGSVMGGGDGPRIRALLLVTDLDQTFVSEALPGIFSRGQLAEMVEVREIGEAEGAALMEEGGASAHLVIPKGFGDDYLNRRAVDIALTTNPSQLISPRLLGDVLESVLDIGDYLHLIMGDELKAIAAGGDLANADGDATAVAADISRKITEVAPFLFPPKVEVVDRTPIPEGRSVGMLLLMFPGVLIMAMFFAGNDIASNYWTERQKGTLARWLISPNNMATFWAGQFASAIVLLGLVTLPILIGGFLYVGIPFEKLISSLVWLMLTGPLLFAFLVVVQVSAPSSRAASVISTLVMFPLLMLGGSVFPTESMPGWLAQIANFIPNGRILEPLKQYFIGTYGSSGLFRDLPPILAATIVLVMVASVMAQRRMRA